MSEKAKTAASKVRNVVTAKTLSVQMGKRLYQLGKSAFARFGHECGPVNIVEPIEAHHARIAQLDDEIKLIEDDHAGHRLTPRRIAIAGSCVFGLFLLGLVTSVFTASDQRSQKLSVLAWNVESGGNDPNVIAAQLRELPHCDVYRLCEVHADNFDRYTTAVGEGFVSFNSTMGRGDRMQISFDGNRFELLQEEELHRYGDHELNNGNHRSPLFVRLKDRKTDVEFIVMANHLARSNADLRTQQAVGLREWARDQNVAVRNIGDFNMDFDFKSQNGNEAFTEMLRDNVWTWVRPSPLIDTNWSDRNGDGIDNYPDSMLDFAFVSGPAKEWSPVCNVIVRDGDFPDDATTSDHRPVELRLTMPE